VAVSLLIQLRYVEQDDVMYRTLTVREILTFAAVLKLPGKMKKKEKQQRVERIMTILGLMPIADTLIGDPEHRGVSGGERKRVSIGTCFCGVNQGIAYRNRVGVGSPSHFHG